MEVILDTNFIVSCVRRKMDFLDGLEELGFKVIVPRDVLEELKDLRLNVSHIERQAVDVALDLFSNRKVKKMKLPKGSVDSGLISLGKKGAYIATLDAFIKRSVPNSVIIDSRKNGLLIEKR